MIVSENYTVPASKVPSSPISEESFALLQEVRRKKPLIHCITNYVTAGDVANIILAAGASPIMANHPEETAEVAALCQALVLNLGTLKETSETAMLRAGREASRLGHPIVLDPVGIGSSRHRTEVILSLLREFPCSIIRGNASEIRILSRLLNENQARPLNRNQTLSSAPAAAFPESRGVDASFSDCITDSTLTASVASGQTLAAKTKAVVVITGAVDIATDGSRVLLIRNGCPEMARITGCGCMMDGILAAFAAAAISPSFSIVPLLDAAAMAAAFSGLCGELAKEKTDQQKEGLGSFRTHFIDSVSLMTESVLKRGVRIES